MKDLTKLTIAELENHILFSLPGWAAATAELLRRYRELLHLAREANRGGLAGADGLTALTAWRLSQPIEPGEECPTCKGAGCAACRGTERRA
jgi:hypothetical protein